MKQKIIDTIKKYNLIKNGDSIVIGVSGGPDSICLLHVLNELKSEFNFKICVAHVNHMIRKEADEETNNTKKEQKLFLLAKGARENAYAPYSNFKVGAAIESQSGKYYAGCNVENISYPVGTCA